MFCFALFFPYKYRDFILEQSFSTLNLTGDSSVFCRGVHRKASVSAAGMPRVCLQHVLSNLEGEDSMAVGSPALTESVTNSIHLLLAGESCSCLSISFAQGTQ